MDAQPVYLVNGQRTAGFGHSKKGSILYITKPELLGEFEVESGARRSGRARIEMIDAGSHAAGAMERLAARILAELARRLRT